jgi:PPK2 family polyphosphate:nucleotide phosphotransferase
MKQYRVKPGEKVHLRDIDPNDTHLVPGGKKAAEKESQELPARLEELQELLYASRKQAILIVLQGMDTSGKDGTIRHVMNGFNPAGTRVASFRKPSQEELDHDYLWRVHHQVPAKGEIAVFNRSHYEDVLVVRVHNLVPKSVWKKRYDHITAFEQMLVDEGTVIRKFFLHISREEQRQRLQARVDDPTKRWKFQHGDIEERELWDDYQEAYEAALEKTSTDDAPWYIVPANHKWYRNHVVASVLVETLEGLHMKYPEPDLSGVKIS